jgi:hypothetical protein
MTIDRWTRRLFNFERNTVQSMTKFLHRLFANIYPLICTVLKLGLLLYHAMQFLVGSSVVTVDLSQTLLLLHYIPLDIFYTSLQLIYVLAAFINSSRFPRLPLL